MGAAFMLYRLAVGLGPTTNMNDAWPFALWIAMDVGAGVALAASGFTMCILIYILQLKGLKELSRQAVLAAWLGYIFVLVGLGMDVGLWYNWFRPMFNWGYTSILFEVFLCVILYNTILFIEMLPVLSKRFNLEKVYKIAKKITIPAVIIGIMLSSLHQSSIGALFLIAPSKMNPIWYSEWVAWMFLLSAMCVGPAIFVLEYLLVSKSYKMKFKTELAAKLMKVSAGVAVAYVGVRLFYTASNGLLGTAFNGSLASNAYLFELSLFVLGAIVIAMGPGRKSKGGMLLASCLLITGVLANRFGIIFAGFYESAPLGYIPTFIEIVVTLAIVCLKYLIFLFIVENFDVLPEEENNPYFENMRELEERRQQQGVPQPSYSVGSK